MSESRSPGAGLRDSRGERLLADLEQALRLRRDLADRERVGGVGDEAVEGHADVDREDVALLQALYSPGIPCTTMSFGDRQSEAGKPL